MNDSIQVFVFCTLLTLGFSRSVSAQFVDAFDADGLAGWTNATGDGTATMEMRSSDGYAEVHVNATDDRDNIWWALIRREVSHALDLSNLAEPHHELRVEARIRTSHAPRRVNLHLNTQRTTDFHSHLMEFDIPDTSGWHTISMTTRNFDARPGDTVNSQLALIDWGRGRYRVDLDYFRVDVVDTTRIGPDYGEPIPYRPPIPPLATFEHHVAVADDAVIDLRHPEVPLTGWHAGNGTPVLTVDDTRYVLLRWDLSEYAERQPPGAGVLTLTTYDVKRGRYDADEYGHIRIVEILGGDPHWTGASVTTQSFTGGRPLDDVVNGQMIIDVEPAARPGDVTRATISRPVLQRLIDGTTPGLLLRPLGPISASFFASEHDDGSAAITLHFNLAD